MFKFIDLFSWIWWFHLAFENIWWECVFASEFNKEARKTYESNFKNISPKLFENWKFWWDITLIDSKYIPDFDILCGWFPCQPFSQAGFKKWFNEVRGTLFYNIANIIKEKQPKSFFLENVRHLLKHDNWKTFEIIKNIIEKELWYSFFYKIVKASDFWLPQNRPRLFMVWFKDKSIKFEFPKEKKLEMTMSDIFWWNCNKDVWFTLRVWWRGSKIDDRRNWDSYLVDGEIKKIWVKEWKKMQWFPDTFNFPVSESQAMKQLWNSVAVPAIQACAENIFYYLNKNNS